MLRSLSAKTFLALGPGLLFVALSVAVVVLVNTSMKSLALSDAEREARMLADHNLAVHDYFSHVLKPKLFEQLGPTTSKDYFEPVWMSSTYAIREMDKHVHKLNPSHYYYKECAINARSPQNEADSYEKAFLSDLQTDSRLMSKSSIRVLGGKPFFTLLRRGEVMEDSCLRCHSSPENAPGDLVKLYGPERSFNRKVNEPAQAISIRIPLSEAFSTASSVSYSLSSLLLVTLGGGLLFMWVGNKQMVVDPIENIKDCAKRIAIDRGRLGETIPEPRLQELRDLAVAFNKMSAALRRSYDKLEERVAERTKDLATERERLAVTLRSIGDGVISTDTESRIVCFNRQAEELTKWTEAEAMGRPLSDVFVTVGEKTGELCENLAERILRTGEPAAPVNRTMLAAKDGSERIVALSGEAIRAENGDILGIVLAFRDVTDQARAEESLRNSEARYRSLFENISNAVAVYEAVQDGEDFILADFNTAGERIDKKDRKDVIGQSLLKVFPGVKEFGLFEVLQRVWRTGEPEQFPVAKYKDERIQGWRDNYLYKLPSGEVVAAYTDETERKMTEEALRQSEETLRLITETVEDVFWMTTSDIKSTNYVSPAYERIWGRTLESLYENPMSFVEAVLPEYREALVKTIEENIESPWKCEYRIARPDGTVRWILDRGFPILDETGNLLLRVGVATDITERKRADEERAFIQNQLREAQRMEAIGALAEGVAHDFNNLLTIINGFTEMVICETAEDDPRLDDLNKILQTGLEGAEVVKRLQSFGKKSDYSPRPLDLNSSVETSVGLMRRSFPKMIEIETILGEDLATVNADASQLEQVLMSLCINAKEAIDGGGKIVIATKNVIVDEAYCSRHIGARPGRHVMVEVSDNGRGISEGVLCRIFDPFFTTKERDFNKGTGLGLSVAKGIIEQHGGWLVCETDMGKGSTLRIFLPAMENSTSGETAEPKVAAAPAIGKILVVDDEDYVRELAMRILERSGYTTIAASNGKEALEIYARERSNIALVILDFIMPHMSGEKCLEEILKICPQAKVILSTGHTFSQDEHERLGDLTVGIVSKPYQLERLLGAVRAALG